MYRVTIIEGYMKLSFTFKFFENATAFMETLLETADKDLEVTIKKIKEETGSEPIRD